MLFRSLTLTYAVPLLHPFRPWVPGDRPPFAVFFGEESEALGPNVVVGRKVKETLGVAAKKAGVSEALMAEAEAAAAEPDEEGGPPPGDGPLPDAAPPSEAPLPDEAPAEEPGPAAAPSPVPEVPVPEPVVKPVAMVGAVDLSPEALAKDVEGITGEVELVERLAPFFKALRATAHREAGAVTRISHYGASEIGADGMTSVTRRKLQARFGSAGKGWVNIAPGWQWYKHKDVVYQTRGWSSRTVTSADLDGKFGRHRYGFGGVAGLGRGAGAEASYKVFADRLEVFYLGYPSGGNLGLSVNGGPEEVFSTKSEEETDLTKVFRGTPGVENTFTVKAKGGGTVHAYGVTLETDGPGVVYDCIQLIGTRGSRFLNYDQEHLRRQTELRKPDLQIIVYGGNELVDRDMALAPYEKKYEEVVRRIHAGAPGGACIVMTPQDHGEKDRGRIVTVPLLKKLIPIQRRVAERAGCAFFDLWSAMGGDGTMGRWYSSNPRLAWGDFTHLTPAGDRVLGAIVYKAIMKGFADWLAQNPG